jgi:hypothetical protein
MSNRPILSTYQSSGRNGCNCDDHWVLVLHSEGEDPEVRSVEILELECKCIEGLRCRQNYGSEDARWPEAYGDWREDTSCNHKWLVPGRLSGSDYSGGLVNRSNYEVFCEEFVAGQEIWWTNVSGWHGTYAVVIDPSEAPVEAYEFLSALEYYPVADDDKLSALEQDAISDAWETWARDDFVKALEEILEEELDSSKIDESELYELFDGACQDLNLEWKNDSGSNMWIDVKVVAHDITEEEISKWVA